MLESLHIENIAVIRKLDLDFEQGLTVLTGETGAGKSIIIDSINMLLGAKSQRELIRSGEKEAFVSAVFSGLSEEVTALLGERGIAPDEDDGTLIVSRSVNTDGKSRAWINAKAVPTSFLREIGGTLITIHGQNDNQRLMKKQNHLMLLDEFAADEEELASYTTRYEKMTALKKEIIAIETALREKSITEDVLRFQIAEIESAKLSSKDEENKLTQLKHKIKNAERIIKNTNLVYRALLQNEKGASAAYLIDRACDALTKLGADVPGAEEYIAKLHEMRYEIEDIAERVLEAGDVSGVDNPDRQLDIIESRLNTISKLKVKYGGDIESILQFKAEAKKKLAEADSYEDRLIELKKDLETAIADAFEAAEIVSEKRVEAAKRLSAEIKEILTFLDMPKVRFEVAVTRMTEDNGSCCYTASGIDDVEFRISANPGESPGPIEKIASGGELSRIMLALKSVLSDKNGALTVIYDEIDTGVSGSTSERIGIQLKKSAGDTQTLCVTHSAQIAAVADNHCLIRKQEKDGRTETAVTKLDEDGRIAELARIIGGIHVTETQMAAAKEMLQKSVNI